MSDSTDSNKIDNNKNSSSSIPLLREEVNVEKKIIETGRVRISKVVKEDTEVLNLPTTIEQVKIERVPVNEIVESMPEPLRYEGDTIIIPVLQEVIVTEKKFLLVEEIHVTKILVSTEETKEITLRKEEINIERDDISDFENIKQ